MSRQIRLRLTGYGGSGVCEWMEQGGKYRYRLSVKGDAGGNIEVLLQSRSPYMERIQSLAMLDRFEGQWQAEGTISAMNVPGGWLWVMRDEKPWLVGVFPDVTTPTEAARRILMTTTSVKAEELTPELFVKIPGVSSEQTEARPHKPVDGRECQVRVGDKEKDPFAGKGFYWAAEGENGLWICWKDS